LEEAREAGQVGDYAAAAQGLHELLGGPLDGAAIRIDLARAYIQDGQADQAIDVLEALVADEEIPEARFLLAEQLAAAGDPLAGADHYRDYIAHGTVITAYVSEWMGDALYAASDAPGAVEAYQAAVDWAPTLPFEVSARERLALAYVAMDDLPAAIGQYEAILDEARIPLYRARIEYQLAETLLLADDIEAGYALHQAIFERMPAEVSSYGSLSLLDRSSLPGYRSLVKLVEAGRPVDDFLRGVVGYYGGAYEAAIASLYRNINAYPDTHSGDTHWFAAQAYLGLGDTESAIREYRLLLETHPESDRRGDAWMALARVYERAEDTDAALEAYREFEQALPDHPLVAAALFETARVLEQDGQLRRAAQAYWSCHTRFPDAEQADDALFRNGLLTFRLGDLTKAALAWDTLATLYPASSYRAAALLWLGRTRLEQQDAEAAAQALAAAQAADPNGYYGVRAAAVSADPGAMPLQDQGYSLTYDAAADQAEAEAWLAARLGIEPDEALGQPSPELVADSVLQRGFELWRVGRLAEARSEFEALREARSGEALTQYQLALLFREIGLYRSSILSAAQAIQAAGVTDIRQAPRFLGRLAYPTYYADLVVENGERYQLDPLLLFSVVRQESLFESVATSSAAAHGLMQVMPPTGAEIAQALDWPPDYETSDLYRPYVSVRFGAYYLAEQRNHFDGRLDAALAGYNGGPSSAWRWLDEAGDDPDIFFETITYSETRLYVRRISEYYAIYQWLYAD
ncbi:MAG: transglycosylase SLT domain-containing protein, partial [Anaerolineales bacterium]|nr:transglycosylase SLT domain-containing protein [Anaerolineales bacterium]